MIDKIISHYKILSKLGEGGMGEVYRAHQVNLKRNVAIKVVSQEWLESCIDNEEELETGLQRFRNEEHAADSLQHTKIVLV